MIFPLWMMEKFHFSHSLTYLLPLKLLTVYCSTIFSMFLPSMVLLYLVSYDIFVMSVNLLNDKSSIDNIECPKVLTFDHLFHHVIYTQPLSRVINHHPMLCKLHPDITQLTLICPNEMFSSSTIPDI